MLVLNRAIGQEIVADGAVRIRIVDIRRGKVRLAVMAPETTDDERPIFRHRKIKRSTLPSRQASRS